MEHSLREVIFLPGTKEVAENRECYYSSLRAVLGSRFAMLSVHVGCRWFARRVLWRLLGAKLRFQSIAASFHAALFTLTVVVLPTACGVVSFFCNPIVPLRASSAG